MGVGDANADVEPAIAVQNVVAATSPDEIAAAAAKQDVGAVEVAIRTETRNDRVEARDPPDTRLVEAVQEHQFEPAQTATRPASAPL